MAVSNIFYSYIYYLIHPFQTHKEFMNKEREEDSKLVHLSAYESLATSWIFVIFNAIVRLFVLNIAIILISEFVINSDLDLLGSFEIGKMTNYSFLILSAVLDIIFYPLFGIVMIQFWEFIFKMYGFFLEDKGDWQQKSQDIISVSFASHILTVIPVLGVVANSIASFILMYAGIKTQFKTSSALAICILMTPVLFFMGVISVFLFLGILFLA